MWSCCWITWPALIVGHAGDRGRQAEEVSGRQREGTRRPPGSAGPATAPRTRQRHGALQQRRHLLHEHWVPRKQGHAGQHLAKRQQRDLQLGGGRHGGVVRCTPAGSATGQQGAHSAGQQVAQLPGATPPAPGSRAAAPAAPCRRRPRGGRGHTCTDWGSRHDGISKVCINKIPACAGTPVCPLLEWTHTNPIAAGSPPTPSLCCHESDDALAQRLGYVAVLQGGLRGQGRASTQHGGG